MRSLNHLFFPLLSFFEVAIGHPGNHHPDLFPSRSNSEKRDTAAHSICFRISATLKTPEDFSAKVRDPVCQPDEYLFPRGSSPEDLGLSQRQADDPYSCNENKPCSNHACCAKTGFCGYGPESCGDSGESPNDKCWSNCDAKAE